MTEKSRKRGIRRFKTKSKILSRSKRIYNGNYRHDNNHSTWTSKDGEEIKITPETLSETCYGQIGQTCSGYMSGNPRKHWGYKTRKEEISEYDFEEQLINDIEE